MEEYLKFLSEFHKKIIEAKLPINRKIKNNLGKTLEEYKVLIKRNKRFIEEHKALASEENLYFIQLGEKSINQAIEANYLLLLQRSMERREICIGKEVIEKIFAMDIENCCYDLIEMDGIQFLSKLKGKVKQEKINELINFYCEQEKLDENSVKFMKALMCFPQEFLKCMNRYRLNKKQWTDEEFNKKLKKSYIKDEISLV